MNESRVTKNISQVGQYEQRLRRVIYPDLSSTPIATATIGQNKSFHQLAQPRRSFNARQYSILIDTPDLKFYV
jgi:hypothetical protein